MWSGFWARCSVPGFYSVGILSLSKSRYGCCFLMFGWSLFGVWPPITYHFGQFSSAAVFIGKDWWVVKPSCELRRVEYLILLFGWSLSKSVVGSDWWYVWWFFLCWCWWCLFSYYPKFSYGLRNLLNLDNKKSTERFEADSHKYLTLELRLRGFYASRLMVSLAIGLWTGTFSLIRTDAAQV